MLFHESDVKIRFKNQRRKKNHFKQSSTAYTDILLDKLNLENAKRIQFDIECEYWWAKQ